MSIYQSYRNCPLLHATHVFLQLISNDMCVWIRCIYGIHSNSLSGDPVTFDESEPLTILYNFLPPSITYSTPSPIFDPILRTVWPMFCELNVLSLISIRIVSLRFEQLFWSTIVKSNGFMLLDEMRLRTCKTIKV